MTVKKRASTTFVSYMLVYDFSVFLCVSRMSLVRISDNQSMNFSED